jgi:hypothetical protein
MQRYKDELMAIADTEPLPERKEDFKRSIEDFFSEFTVETTLGQYAGVVESVGVEKKDEKILPRIELRLSRIQALIGDMFGEKLEIRAFSKAMKDFGISNAKIQELGLSCELARKDKENSAPLIIESQKAVFEIGSSLLEDVDGSFAQVREIFETVYSLSLRGEINDLLGEFNTDPEKTRQNISTIAFKFLASISSKTEASEIEQLTKLIKDLGDQSPEVAQKAAANLRQFKTKAEKKFLEEA